MTLRLHNIKSIHLIKKVFYFPVPRVTIIVLFKNKEKQIVLVQPYTVRKSFCFAEKCKNNP